MDEPELDTTPTKDADRPWIELKALSEAGDLFGMETYLGELSGVDAMRALLHLTTEQQTSILAALDPKIAAEVLDDVPDTHAADLMKSLEPSEAAEILETMPVDEQADLIGDIEDDNADAILSEMKPAVAGDVRNLTQHEPDTAGGLMSTDIFSFPARATVGDVLIKLTKQDSEFERYRGQHPYITDDKGRLVGVVSLRNLLLSQRNYPLSSIMTDAMSVSPETELDDLQDLFKEHPFLGLPVTNHRGLIVGTVSRMAVTEAATEKADQDRLSVQGIVDDEIRSMPTLVRSRRRLAWLSINIMLNIIAASVIALYEDTLAAVIALAVFLPIVSDMSGCSGNQAVAVSMRELALGLTKPFEVFQVWLKEASVGLINGVVLGLLLGSAAWLWKGNLFLGLVVGTALAMNTVVAVSIGGCVPLLLKRFGADPAVASGPILTTVTDMAGFFMVLTLATYAMPLLVL